MITESDLTAELRKLNAELNPGRQPGEFTCMEYAKANGMTRDVARGVLSRGLKAGRLTSPKEKRFIDKAWQAVYKVV